MALTGGDMVVSVMSGRWVVLLVLLFGGLVGFDFGVGSPISYVWVLYDTRARVCVWDLPREKQTPDLTPDDWMISMCRRRRALNHRAEREMRLSVFSHWVT